MATAYGGKSLPKYNYFDTIRRYEELDPHKAPRRAGLHLGLLHDHHVEGGEGGEEEELDPPRRAARQDGLLGVVGRLFGP